MTNLKHIWEPAAYGPSPIRDCWWADTVAPGDWPALEGDTTTDVAIVVRNAHCRAADGRRIVVLSEGKSHARPGDAILTGCGTPSLYVALYVPCD